MLIEEAAPRLGGAGALRARDPLETPPPPDPSRRIEEWLACHLDGRPAGTAAEESEWDSLIPGLSNLRGRSAARRGSPDFRGPAEGWSHLKVIEKKDVTLARLLKPSLVKESELDGLAEELLALVDVGHHRLILDFSAVERLSSQIVGTIMTLDRRCRAAEGGQLRLFGLGPAVARVFDLTGTAGRLKVVADEAAALEEAWPAGPPLRPLPVEVLAALINGSASEQDEGVAATEPVVALILDRGPQRGRSVPLPGDRLLIGRERPCDLRIDAPTVSRRHALVERRGGRLWVRDLGTTNGTFVNGRRIGTQRVELACGDVLAVGPARFRIAVAAAPADLDAQVASWLRHDDEDAEPERRDDDTALDLPARDRPIRHEVVSGVLVLTPVTGDLTDTESVERLRDRLKELADLPLPKNVVINLDCVRNMSGRAVGVLLAHHLRLERSGGALRLGEVHARVFALLDRIRLTALIPCYPTVDEAVLTAWG